MNTLILSVLGALLVAVLLHKAIRRLELSRAKHRSLAGHARLLRSGDTLGGLVFLGLTARGEALCLCACGRVETLPTKTLTQFLRFGRAKKRANRLRCSQCIAPKICSGMDALSRDPGARAESGDCAQPKHPPFRSGNQRETQPLNESIP